MGVPADELEVVPVGEMVQVPEVALRPYRAADKAFVYGTWLQGHYEKSLWAKGMEWEAYKYYHQGVLERLLREGRTVVACAPEESNQILGYCNYYGAPRSPPVLNYVFVKGPFRRFGVGSKLLEVAGFGKTQPFAFTHLNDSPLVHRLRKQWPLGKYVPYLLF